MNDTERNLREMFQRREADPLVPGATPASAPRDLVRRSRRRQLRNAIAGGLVVAIVVAGSVGGALALLRLGQQVRPAGVGSSETRTSTVYGVTIAYPQNWSLLQLWQDATVVNPENSKVGPTGAMTGHAVLQLGNAEPSPSDSKVCLGGLPDGVSYPEGSVALYVQQLDWPRLVGTTPATWPVEPSSPAPKDPGYCDPSAERYATWTANGRIYEAFLGGAPGPAFDRLLEAFRSMTFSQTEPSFDPILVNGTPAAPPYYILDSGVTEGQPWNLLAYASSYPLAPTRVCIDLEVAGTSLGGQCNLDMSLGGYSGAESTSARVRFGGTVVTYAWGALSNDVVKVGLQLDGGSALGQWIAAMPAALQVDFRALVVAGTGDAKGALVTSNASGHQVGALPFGLDDFAQPIDIGPGSGSS
jgi:hypothetical protein